MKPKYAEACIIGLGPAGLGAALKLARSPLAKSTICLECGVAADLKSCSIKQGKRCLEHDPCQVVTGVGGSSLLSGQKISLFPAGRSMAGIIGSNQETKENLDRALCIFKEFIPLISSEFSEKFFREGYRHYLKKGFEFRYYPSYLFRKADIVSGYTRMLKEVTDSGCFVALETRVTEISPTDNGYHIICSDREKENSFFSKRVILGVGRFGFRLIRSIDSTLSLGGRPNHFDAGVRLEFPVNIWPDIDRFHNDLKLHFGNARTFCVCKNGYLAPYRMGEIFIVEGCADPCESSGFTNLAITRRITAKKSNSQYSFLRGLRRYLIIQTDGKPIRQRLTDFLENRPSHEIDESRETASIAHWHWGNANDCFPEDLAKAIRDSVRYFVSRLLPTKAYPVVYVYAPEFDYYTPKFTLREGFHSLRENVFLIGDCSGHFRGILQAFCSGISCSEHILKSAYVQ